MLKVSIIITTKDSEDFIGQCIDSIKASTYKDIEIIVVDNYSTDSTRMIALEKNVEYYFKGPERSAQRNYGVFMATGEYVLILDVDMTIHPELIKECVSKCEGYKRDLKGGGILCPPKFEPMILGYDALYIPAVILHNNFWGKVRNYERRFYNATRIDAIRFIRKSKWIDYDLELTGAEDWDHDRRFKGSKGITSHPLCHNEKGFSFKKYTQKKGYYSQWLDIYKRRYPGCPEMDPFYRYFWVFMENGKWKMVIRHPILFCATIILRLVVGATYLCAKKK